jgi:hypothetical protein
MNTHTKEQIRHLTPQQQLLALHRALSQQYRRLRWMPWLILGMLCFVCFFGEQNKQLLGVAAILWGLVQFHAENFNRRLNTLMELFESDRKTSHDA